jgi:hypothetical protein
MLLPRPVAMEARWKQEHFRKYFCERSGRLPGGAKRERFDDLPLLRLGRLIYRERASLLNALVGFDLDIAETTPISDAYDVFHIAFSK